MAVKYIKTQINYHRYLAMMEEIKAIRRENFGHSAIFIEKDIDYKSLPEVQLYLKRLGIERYVFSVNHIVVMPDEPIWPHIDDPGRFVWSLTIPFENIKGTYNRFYQSDKPQMRVEDDTGIDRGKYAVSYCLQHEDVETAEITDKVEVDGPMFINTTVMHDVINETDKPREALAFRIERNWNWRTLGQSHLRA